MGIDKKQITFEEYLALGRDQDPKDLNICKLKHAFVLNGFGGMKHLTRKQLVDALKAVNLTPPTRSTINQSSDGPIRSRHVAPLSLDELKRDIQEMGWQECPIGSVVTLDPATFGVVKSPVNKSPVNKRKKRGRKGKRTEGNEVENSTVDKKKKRIRKGKGTEGNELALAVAVADRDDIELGTPDINKSTVDNKKKRVRKVNKRNEENEIFPPALPSAESLVADDVAKGNGDDVEWTSPVKKTSETIRVSASMLNDVDEFSWMSKGFQKIKGSPHPRNYFKCQNWKKGCPARRSVDQDPIDPSILIITYYNGQHNHSAPYLALNPNPKPCH